MGYCALTEYGGEAVNMISGDGYADFTMDAGKFLGLFGKGMDEQEINKGYRDAEFALELANNGLGHELAVGHDERDPIYMKFSFEPTDAPDDHYIHTVAHGTIRYERGGTFTSDKVNVSVEFRRSKMDEVAFHDLAAALEDRGFENVTTPITVYGSFSR